MALSNPTLPEITDGYKTQLHHEPGHDLEKLSEITQNKLDKREDLIRRYDEEYDSRVDTARQRLQLEATQARFDHPAPRGAPGIDSDVIAWQAHQQVRLAHDADLQRTSEDALRQMEELMHQAYQRNQIQGSATEAFLRAGERRPDGDPRIPKHSQD